jgi:CheY-like chemotaxis protein
VLLDLMMPVLDGYAVYRAWNADPSLRGAHRLIVMSAAGRLRVGDFPLADALLPKPFDLVDLLDVVEVLAADLPEHVPLGPDSAIRDAPWAG